MKAFKHNIILSLLVAAVALLGTGCNNDKLDPNSIFVDVDDELDPTSTTYKFDKWLQENYQKPYNLQFLYRMQDVGTNMNYNLVPATYENSIDLAVLTKYLWFDVYGYVVNFEFLKENGPRIIHLIGSPAYNPTSGTEIVGLAEGGIKVSLFKVNAMDINDFNMMNEYYFKTMHHEFTHILHQKKTYPSEFNTLSVGHYDAANWQDRSEGQVASLGFVSTYASSEFREDFAETVANYIVKTDEQWDEILDMASRGWATPSDEGSFNAVYYCYFYYTNNEIDPDNVQYLNWWEVAFVEEGGETHMYKGNDRDKDGNRIVVYNVPDTDGVDGVAVIERKVAIAREWLRDEWGVDLDALRKEVQYRQLNYDIDELRKQVDDIK